MKILLDMDGVIVDLLPEWLLHYRQVGGEPLTPKNFHTYNWEDQVQNRKLFLQVLKSGGLFSSAQPMSGALVGLANLRKKHDVTLVTKVMGGSSRAFDAKIGWLWRFVRPQIPTADIVFTGAKHLISGDVLVEDSPQNLVMWLAANPLGMGFLIDHPYNKHFGHIRVTRVSSLVEVGEILARFT